MNYELRERWCSVWHLIYGPGFEKSPGPWQVITEAWLKIL
jgi:hypothetical protein